MQPEKIIDLYENLRNKAEENVLKTGTVHLDTELTEWRIVNRPENKSKDLIISISINGEKETLIIPTYNIVKDVMGEQNRMKAGRLLAIEIKKRLSSFIADKIGETVFYQAGSNILDLK